MGSFTPAVLFAGGAIGFLLLWGWCLRDATRHQRQGWVVALALAAPFVIPLYLLYVLLTGRSQPASQ